MRAKDVMTKAVVTVRSHTPVRRAAGLLNEHGVTALPVVDGDGDLVGIVTEADVVRGRIQPDPRSRLATRSGTGAPPDTVGEVMTRSVVRARLGADVRDLAKLMLRRGLRCVPIVDGTRLVGVVTRRDLVRCLARPDDVIAADVRHRLEIYSGHGRWLVRVERGRVELVDDRDDPAAAHAATVIAAAIPGVEHVRVRGHRSDQPEVVGPGQRIPSGSAPRGAGSGG